MEQQNKICSVCGVQLKETDDVVCCATCGAPYHRECYKTAGDCVYSELHGTEYEYKQSNATELFRRKESGEDLKVKIEPVIQERETTSERKIRSTIPPEMLGGYNETDDIGGVTAGDVGKFVSFNPARYVSLFAKMALAGKKFSFNILAFLVPEGWFFLRKNYQAGIVVSVCLAIAEIMCFPAANFLSVVAENATIPEYYAAIMQNLSSMPRSVLVLFTLSGLINLLIRVVSGVFGDLIYKNKVFNTIKEYRKKNPTDDGAELLFKGGINPFAMLLGFAIASFLPTVLVAFL